MDLYGAILKPILFRADPEFVHDLGMAAIASGMIATRQVRDTRLETTCFGTTFANPIGLAAGFDKNARAVEQWDDLGFGFAELGTITAQPQPGNPKPRLFRLPDDAAIINRMGFNNEGSAEVANRLSQLRPTIPIGINIGKSKVTPLENAAEDYAQSYVRLAPYADYVVVNVSSPNTPGLRNLQAKGELQAIFTALRPLKPIKPLFVKIAPDLSVPELDDVLECAIECKLTGIIATNTTLGRECLTNQTHEAGGLSGRPLKQRSEAVLRFLAQKAPKDLVLVSVGGIESAEDVRNRIMIGAHLVQIYTGWVYGGPHWVPDTLEHLLLLAERDGIRNIAEWRCQSRPDPI